MPATLGIKKRVFLSHSTADAVLTRLVGHILQSVGLECFYSERDIPIGREFDQTIISQIHSCNVFLVIWTAHAAVSPWVNQEIGIALAKNIPVWPLAIDDTLIQGAMFRRQGSLLSHDAAPAGALQELARAIQQSSRDEPFEPHVDQFVIGKEERTRRIVSILSRDNNEPTSDYTLRVQAAFSCFAVSAGPEYRVAGYHTPEYHHLLIQEKHEAARMAGWAQVRLIIWPQRPYEDAFMTVRFRNLIDFLTTNSAPDRVRVVMGGYQGGSKYIFDRNALVTGIKSPGSLRPGYDLTTITYHGPTIAAEAARFDRRFIELWEEHVRACSGSSGEHSEDVRAHVIRNLKQMAPRGEV